MESPLSAFRADVLPHLQRVLPGRNLYEVAAEVGVVVRREGRLNKGWAGQTIEKVAALNAGSAQRRDGDDFELKSTTLVQDSSGQWQPRETIKITAMNPRAILEETFENSALWGKLERLVLVGTYHPTADVCEVVRVCSFDCDDPELVAGVRAYWEEVRAVILMGEIADYSSLGTSENWLQLRPTGNRFNNSTCPITGRRYQAQAFYGTKPLLRRILGLSAARPRSA